MRALLGKKIGMTQVFMEDGRLVPVTTIEAGPCLVVQVKTPEKDGYWAIQLGYGEIEKEKRKKVNQPLKGHFAKAKVTPQKYLAEIPVSEGEEYQVGQKITADIFSEGEYVDVAGISKGKGFAGVVKRWGFSGGPASHGSHFHRAPGSIGAASTPSRVFKGRKMPGQLGGSQVVIQNLEVVKVEPELNLILVKGGIPGARNSQVIIRASVKGKIPKKKPPVKEEVPAEPARPPVSGAGGEKVKIKKKAASEEEPREEKEKQAQAEVSQPEDKQAKAEVKEKAETKKEPEEKKGSKEAGQEKTKPGEKA